MESTGLKWNEKKCAVIHVKRRQVSFILDGYIRDKDSLCHKSYTPQA